MQKLSYLVGTEWIEHTHKAVYEIERSTSSVRLRAGVPGGDAVVFSKLVARLEPPYLLLYVLHTPRGEAEAGRYQGPELSASEFATFVERFGTFLSSDARFDVWAHSPADAATVVWDRHNEIFAYGPLQEFASELRALGYTEGKLASLETHAHHYRPEFDAQASQLLAAYEWVHTPLRPEDEQLVGA